MIQKDGIQTLLAACLETGEAGDDRMIEEALVRCAAAITTAEVDCPLGALVVDGNPASWSCSVARLVKYGARGVEPVVILRAIADCARHDRAGAACPLAHVRHRAPEVVMSE